MNRRTTPRGYAKKELLRRVADKRRPRPPSTPPPRTAEVKSRLLQMQNDLKREETKEYMSYRDSDEKKVSLNKEVSEAMRAAESRLEEASAIIASQKKQIENQRLQCAEAKREIATLKANLDLVKEKLIRARDRRDERELIESNLRERLSELEARPEHDYSVLKLRNKISTLEKERDEACSREKELKRELKRERKQTESLSNTISPLKSQLEERNRYTDKLAARLRKFEIEERQHNNTKSKRKLYSHQDDESSSNSGTITRLKRQVKALKLANRQLKLDFEASQLRSKSKRKW